MTGLTSFVPSRVYGWLTGMSRARVRRGPVDHRLTIGTAPSKGYTAPGPAFVVRPLMVPLHEGHLPVGQLKSFDSRIGGLIYLIEMRSSANWDSKAAP